MSKLEDKLSFIGINYQTPIKQIPASPEEALIALSLDQDTLSDKKNLILFITWMTVHYKLIHVERLKSMLIEFNLPLISQAIIAGIISTILPYDHRFKVIIKMLEKSLSTVSEPLFKDDAFMLRKRGEDPHFSLYKLQIAKLEIETQRKLKPITQMIKDNPWIKNRILFGSNLRADIATIRELELASTAYAASKLAKCSPNAAKRNWDDLELVNF